MNKKDFVRRLNEIEDTIADAPAKADADIDALSKVMVPIEEARFFLKSRALTKAKVSFVRREFEGCISFASEYISWETQGNHPDLKVAHLLRGKAYLSKGDPGRCLLDLGAIDPEGLDPDFLLDIYKHRANALSLLERFDEVIEVFQDIKRLAPEDTEHLSELAAAYRQTENHQQLITLLTEAARIDPQDTNILANLGTAYLEINEFETAEAVLTKVISEKPDEAEFYEQRAVIREKLGKRSASEDRMIARFLNPKKP